MEPGAWDKVEVLADLGRGVSIDKKGLGETKIIRKVELPGVGQGIKSCFEAAKRTCRLKKGRVMRQVKLWRRKATVALEFIVRVIVRGPRVRSDKIQLKATRSVSKRMRQIGVKIVGS